MHPCSEGSESCGLRVEGGRMALVWCSVWHSLGVMNAFKPSNSLKADSTRVKLKNLTILSYDFLLFCTE